MVDTDDLLVVIANWGSVAPGNIADLYPLGGNGLVDADDLLVIISNWGIIVPCNTFTLNKAGTGQGTVTTDVPGINCGLSCQTQTAYFTEGTILNLSQIAGPTSIFSSWAGACTGSGSCTVTMTGNKTVTANFSSVAPTNFTLNVTKSGTGAGTVTSTNPPGGINCGSDCTEQYQQNTSVTLSATPTVGSVFVNWTGACSVSANTCVISMTSDKNAGAVFNLSNPTNVLLYVVKSGTGLGTVISTNPPGGINCGNDCDEPYPPNTLVTLTAIPTAGSFFAGWTGSAFACGSSPSCVVTMNAGKTVVANFDATIVNLIVTKSGPGTGTVTSAPSGINCGSDCNEPFNQYTSVTLTATPTAGSSFVSWTGVTCDGGNNTQTCTFSTTNAMTANAAFSLNGFYTITVTKSGSGGGQITSTPPGVNCSPSSPGGCNVAVTFPQGTTLTLTATPLGASVFSNWTGDCTGSINLCTVTMTSNKNINAVFTSNSGGTTVPFTNNQATVASDGAPTNAFGTSVAIDGDIAVVGATSHSHQGGPNTGTAYVYRRSGSTWTQDAELRPSDGVVNDGFGISVAVSGNVVVVGSYQSDISGHTDAGAAYVYRYNGSAWVQEQKIFASDGNAVDTFGWAVGISGNNIIVGAYRVQTAGINSGAAYTFNYNGSAWNQTSKLTAFDAAASDFFGVGVAISGNTAVVGAYLDDDHGSSSGSAYIFETTNNGLSWSPSATQKIAPADGATEDRFGRSVSVSGNRIAVGAALDSDVANSAGSVYVYEKNGANWILKQKIFANDGLPFDNFGNYVGISGDNVVVGAQGVDQGGGSISGTGAAYIFKYDGTNWVQYVKMRRQTASDADNFGSMVGISGSRAIAGVPGYDNVNGNGFNSGAAFIYDP